MLGEFKGIFREVLRSGTSRATFVPDDRDAAKIWSVGLLRLCANLLHAIAVDPNGNVRSDFSASQVLPFVFGRAHAALPSSLRGCPRSRAVPLAPPALFSFVKLK